MGFSVGAKANNKQQSSTVYPTAFLDQLSKTFGAGVPFNELLGALPQTQSLFGGGQIGYGQLGGQPQQGAAGQAGGLGAAPAAPRGATFADVQNIVGSMFPENRAKQQQLFNRFESTASRQGWDPNNLPLDQFAGATFGGNFQHYLQNNLPQLLQQQLASEAVQQQPRFGVTGQADLSGLDVNNRIAQLFAPRPDAQPWQFSQVPTVQAGAIDPGLMAIAPGGFDRFEQALFQSMNDPAQRQLAQQGLTADRRLQADLAQAGLASSGAGQAQIQEQRRQQSEQSMAVAQQAAQQATVQRFGQEFAQAQFNAGQEQQARIQQAGFDLDAQKQNAANILAGDQSKSDNYLKTIGLNNEQATLLRNDFMGLLGIAQADLARISQTQMESLGMLLNNWLQQGALVGNLGQQSTGGGQKTAGFGGGLLIGSAGP